MGLKNLFGKRGAKAAAAKAESPEPSESPAKSEAPVGVQSDGSRDAADAAALAAKVANETRDEAGKSGVAGTPKPGMNAHVKAVADLAFGMVNPF